MRFLESYRTRLLTAIKGTYNYQNRSIVPKFILQYEQYCDAETSILIGSMIGSMVKYLYLKILYYTLLFRTSKRFSFFKK
jgi:hypothetical protein